MSTDPGDSYDLADDAPPPRRPAHQAAAGDYPPGYAPQPLGYAGYGSLPVYDNSDRARTASILVKVYAALSVLTAVFASVPYFVGDFAAAEDPFAGDSTGIVAASNIGNLIVGCVGIILFIVAAVFYCMWQYRATANANATGNPTVFGPGLGVGAWFIPLANLVMAPMMLFSLWRASGRADRGGGGVAAPGALLAIFLLSIFGGIALAIAAGVIGAQSTGGGGPGPAFGVILGVASLVSGLLGALFWFGLGKYVDEVQSVQPQPTAA